jgi:PEP-CTERM motif
MARFSPKLSLMFFAASGVSVYAATYPPGPPCKPGESRAATITEYSRRQNADFIVHLTDWQGLTFGNPIQLPGINIPNDGSVATLDIPLTANACDAWNETVIPKQPNGGGGGGGKSSLRIERVQFDPGLGIYQLFSVFDPTAPFEYVWIPDLYAADANGLIDPNGILYSLVDLTQYVPTMLPFSLGQQFNVVNGVVAGLSGMKFATGDFTFDPATGFTGGTPYTGIAVAETAHVFPSVPEPETLTLLGIGAALIAVKRSFRQT